MTPDTAEFLKKFDALIATKDMSLLDDLLADDVALAPPPHWATVNGKEQVSAVLCGVFASIEEFTYHRRWVNGRDVALEFTGRVGEKNLHGIDLIALDDSARIRKIDVLARPLNGIAALGEAVARHLRAAKGQ